MRSSLYIAAGSAAFTMGLRLEAREGQTSAVCSPSFNWMENSKQDSPCQAAALVDAVCSNGQWIIPALNSSVVYTNPTGPTATICTCSWANYNLLSACTACQGFSEVIAQWTVFKSGCTADELSDTFFPAQIALPSDVAIPAWAQQDPTLWTNEVFSVSQAQTIANQNLSDFVGGTSPIKKTNIGPVLSGVICGTIVIVGAVIVTLQMIRRRRKSPGMGGTYTSRPSRHMRFESNSTALCMISSPPVVPTRWTSSTPIHGPIELDTPLASQY